VKRIPLIMAIGALLLVLSAGVALAHLNHINCDPDRAKCQGTDERDHISGSNSGDNIYADRDDGDNNGRADVVEADAGDDIVRGQEGNDELGGGEDDDTLYGNIGDDEIFDRFAFGPDDEDTVYGASGDDEIDVLDGDGDDVVSCGTGRDRVWADPGDDVKGNCERESNDPDDPNRPDFNTGDTTATASASTEQYSGETTESS
jgi:Ca2+-binding RTX toxin-like protein